MKNSAIVAKVTLVPEPISTKMKLSAKKIWRHSSVVLKQSPVSTCLEHSINDDQFSMMILSIFVIDSTRSTGFSAIKLTALGRPNLLVSPQNSGGWWGHLRRINHIETSLPFPVSWSLNFRKRTWCRRAWDSEWWWLKEGWQWERWSLKTKTYPFLIAQSPDSLTRPSFFLPISDKVRILDLEDSNTLSKRFALS